MACQPLGSLVTTDSLLSWVCESDDVVVMQLEQKFKTTLQQPQTLKQWALRFGGVASTILKPCDDGKKFTKVAQEFFLKWLFCR